MIISNLEIMGINFIPKMHGYCQRKTSNIRAGHVFINISMDMMNIDDIKTSFMYIMEYSYLYNDNWIKSLL